MDNKVLQKKSIAYNPVMASNEKLLSGGEDDLSKSQDINKQWVHNIHILDWDWHWNSVKK